MVRAGLALNDEGKSEIRMTKNGRRRDDEMRTWLCVALGFPALSLIRHSSKLRFFDEITIYLGLGAPGKLAGKDRRRIGRYQFVVFQDEFRINRVAGGLINLVATEVTIEFVFVIVVAAEVEFLPIRGELLFFIQHHELRFTPRLARAADITPELEIRFIIAASD